MDISIHGDKKNTEGKKILLRIQFFFSPHDKLSLENLIQVIKLKLPFLTSAPFNRILVTQCGFQFTFSQDPTYYRD